MDTTYDSHDDNLTTVAILDIYEIDFFGDRIINQS